MWQLKESNITGTVLNLQAVIFLFWWMLSQGPQVMC